MRGTIAEETSATPNRTMPEIFRRRPKVKSRLSSQNQFAVAVWFIAPGLIAFVLFVAYPLIATVITSFFSVQPRGAEVYKQWVGLAWFREALLEDRIFRLAMLNTILWALWSVVIDIPLAFGLAYVLRSRIAGWHFFRAAWFIPILLSPVLVGLMFRSILRYDGGILNEILTFVNLGHLKQDWLSRPSAIIWLFLMTTWQTVGFYMVMILAALEDFSQELLDAARIDGASSLQQVFRVVIPALRPVLATITVLTFVYKMRVFDLVWVTTQGGPFGRTETVVTRVVQRAFYFQGSFNLGYPAAMSVIWLVCMAIGVWMLRRLLGGRSHEES